MRSSTRHDVRRGQLLLDWGARAGTPPAAPAEPSPPPPPPQAEPAPTDRAGAPPRLSAGAAAIIHAHLPPPDVDRRLGGRAEPSGPVAASPADGDSGPPPPAQILPWDFQSSFPEPLEEAIDAGRLHEDDAHPENLRALHEEHARHALTLLSDLDAVADARRRGVDPRTGSVPKSARRKAMLQALFRDEPERLERAFEVSMDVYEEAFGADAADAFRKAVGAWHAGVAAIAGHPPAAPPLTRAVDAGVFGREEDGAAVNPGAEEMNEITRQLIDELLPLPDGPGRRALLMKYAGDFGGRAARELDRWCRLQSQADDTASFDYDPGHSWHYYHEGDGAEPMPLESIPARDAPPERFAAKWPKNPAKRRALMERMLFEQRTQLTEDEKRYQSLIDDGVEALNRYDREIAHGGNDELAWASAVSLKYNHISGTRGRIRTLERELGIRRG